MPMTEEAIDVFGRLGLTPLGQLDLFLRMYGHFFIYALLSACTVLMLIVERKRAITASEDRASIFLFSCFFSFSAVIWLTDYVRPLTHLSSGRLIFLVTALFPPLVGLALYRIGGMRLGDRPGSSLLGKANLATRCVAIALIITICSVIGIFSLYRSPDWCFLTQSIVTPILIKIFHILIQQSPKVILGEYNDMIQHLLTATSDPAFGHSILPGAAIHDSCRLQTKGFDRRDYVWTEG